MDGMLYRQLGASDLTVSEIALGTWLTFGGGVSKEWERWGRFLTRKTPIRTAEYLNVSGIIGAAYAAGAARQAHLRASRVPAPESDPQVPSALVGIAD